MSSNSLQNSVFFILSSSHGRNVSRCHRNSLGRIVSLLMSNSECRNVFCHRKLIVHREEV